MEIPAFAGTTTDMRIDFYHLTAAPLEKVLPSICEKLLGAGGRLLIVTNEVEQLDATLWSYVPESFLPHGPVTGPRAADQPVLLSTTAEPVNQARNIALADGVWRDEALSFDRVFYFFDRTTIDTARASWRALANRDGARCHYWKQDDRGRWVEGP